jgi:radical SAM protein with 4Fe4S-binding SPASM domain
MIQLHLETSGYCNAKCSFCPYNSDENKALPKGFMTEALSEKVIRDAATIPHITSMLFSGLSEPLLDQLIEKRAVLARKLRPDWLIGLYTNGFLLTPERFDSLKASGIDSISVSLNAITSAQHEDVMKVRGKFQTVMDHINYARANSGSNGFQVTAVATDDKGGGLTDAEARVFMTLWGMTGVGDGVGRLTLSMNWADKTRLIGGRVLTPNSTCNRALGQLSVSWAGHVNLCCLDPYGNYRFGDLNNSTIREIYNSAEYIEFREWHRDEVAAKHPLCAKCTRI